MWKDRNAYKTLIVKIGKPKENRPRVTPRADRSKIETVFKEQGVRV
jgi:hypothetical protein